MKDTYSEREGMRVRNVDGCKRLCEEMVDNLGESSPLELGLVYHLAVVQANSAFSDVAQERTLTVVNPLHLAGLTCMANG